jgi:hypothetical protein
MPDAILKHVPGMAAATPVPTLDAVGLSEAEFRNTYVAHSRLTCMALFVPSELIEIGLEWLSQ